MNAEQQRIAIAKVCGWVIMPDNRAFNKTSMLDDDTCVCDSPPNYLNDLNAMHEAEKSITDNTGYIMALKAVIGEYLSPFALVTATAAQRAEAFLKHKNLWER